MQWQKVNEHYIESDQKYRITKGRNISIDAYTYVAHTPDGKFFAFVNSAKEAMQKCDEHNEQRSKK